LREGKGLDARKLAAMLRPYGVRPRSLRIDDKTPKGYRADDLRDAWARYLPSGAQQAQLAQQAEPNRTTPALATDSPHEKAHKHWDVAAVAAVADPENVGPGSATDVRDSRNTNEQSATIADLSDGALLISFGGSTLLDPEHDSTDLPPHDPHCPYPATHAGRSWGAHDGRMVCGVCHPPADPDLVAGWAR
jgi:Protein of unknown function (DUF3631)